MSRIAYVNGRYVPHGDAAVHVEDRGYQFADGVYEVCEVRGGRLVDAPRHLQRLVRSPWGRVLQAVREDEDAAQALGKDTFSLKLQSFVLGAAIMGLSGAFFAFWLRGVSPPPNSFTAADTFAVWVIVIIGGTGNNRGVLAGAIVVPFLEFFSVRAKSWFNLTGALATQIFYFRLIAIGIVLIILVMSRPQGIFPEPKYVAKRPRWLVGR